MAKWWHWLERENIPVVYCNLRDSAHAHKKEFKDLAKTYLRHIFVWENQIVRVYWHKQDLNSFSKYFLDQIHTDYLEKLEKNHYDKSNALIKYCKFLSIIDFSKLSNKQLLFYLKAFEKLYSDLAIYTYIPVIGTFPLEKKAEAYLKSKLKNQNLFGRYYSVLTQPNNKSWIRKHDEDLAQIAKTNDPNEFNRLLDLHVEKYSWIELGYQFLANPLTKEDFIKKMQDIKITDNDPIKKAKIITKLGIDRKHEQLFSALSKIIWLKEYRDGVYTKSHLYLNRILGEVLKRNNLSKQIGYYLKLSEYKDLLMGKQLKPIEPRKNLFVWMWDSEEQYFHGRNAKTVLSEEIGESNIINYSKVIKGTVASPGISHGKAKVILNETQLHKLKHGEIIVTSMTKPSFITAMKKASAIITNEGGITCHAAIVSRELQKPCIIGLKTITKIINDGDVIEVDANKGVVRILEQKNESTRNN